MADISVVGIGNIIMQDEGFGVRCAEYLQKITDYPDFVQIIDGGTLGMDLMPYIAGTKKLLFIDAIDVEGNVGDFYQFTGDELNAYFKNKITIHDVGVNDMLAVLKLTDNPIEEVIVMGIKPEIVSMGLDMTEKVAEKVPEVAQKAKELVDKWVAQHQG
ncbi:HyaD/HybD family hydrogenase maturation endopeptidase [uncultured Megamonas sp.]|uniref:HyaD/HybD family hydrogenase maturation endopeptidase n=1 Tax=Megamonas funiformis TaxID=437897 RepID=UPI0025DED1A7|nr:HyaD/HybD family hydrogenase maturation endopeptidase [uncultured Megamonas sp.]